MQLKTGDTSPPARVTLTDGDTPVNLTAATAVKFRMGPSRGPLKVDAAMTVTDAAAGVLTYRWQTPDTDTAGLYRAEVEVTWSDGTVQTFPGDGYLSVHIRDDLD